MYRKYSSVQDERRRCGSEVKWLKLIGRSAVRSLQCQCTKHCVKASEEEVYKYIYHVGRVLWRRPLIGWDSRLKWITAGLSLDVYICPSRQQSLC